MIKEKHKVMAGFEPRPARKYPIPISLIEFAITSKNTPNVQIPQETCIAIFRPRLSAMKGMIRNPTREPIKTIDCRIVDVLSQSKYGSKSNTILFGCSVMMFFHSYLGELQTNYVQSLELLN